ncbi:MAG TPA: hypothetical protein VKQ06_00970, partial [Gammaproteobacteria bacterium]|nr:hypothetical protein [Gammaproteobacteria bacterium]
MQLNSRPIVVSLYSSHDYYREAAERLRADCNRLNIESDIVELAGSGDKDWISICRAKVPFFLEMFDKHERPILWLDADSRLRDWPVVFDGLRCDLAGFLRGLRYLRDFDPVALPRFFAPFALFFGASPAARAFLETMVELERGFTDAATDDYFLEQAWREHERQLAIAVLPPSLVDKDWPPAAGAPIHVGVSGNVTTHKSNAQQHVAPLHEAARRRAMLLSEAGLARKAGQPNDALVLYRRAA